MDNLCSSNWPAWEEETSIEGLLLSDRSVGMPWGHFKKLIIHVGGTSPLWVMPSLGKWAYAVGKAS